MIEKWLNVQKDFVQHPKLRHLRKTLGCSGFEAVGMLVTLWTWALDTADENGLILYCDESDIELYLSFAGASETLDCKRAVAALIECGWIDKHDDGLYIHDWEEQQKYTNRHIKRLKNQAEKRRNAGIISEEPEVKEKEEKKAQTEYSADFIQFWEKYPRKADKGAAFKKFKARVKDGFNPKDLILAAECYANECRKLRTQPQYIKQAKTFLSDSLPFSDYIVKEVEEPLQGNPFAKYLPRDEIEL